MAAASSRSHLAPARNAKRPNAAALKAFLPLRVLACL